MRVMVTHLSGERRGHRELFDGAVIAVGRGRRNQIRLGVNDTRASAQHAEVRLENGRYYLVDVGSTNGTFVNGRRIDRYRLRNADVISFGFGGPELLFEFFEELPEVGPSVAETHEFPIKFVYRRWLWGISAGFLLLMALAVAFDWVLIAIPSALVSAALFFMGLAFSRVNLTVGPAGIEHEGLFRTRRIPWTDVVALETLHRRTGLLPGTICLVRGKGQVVRFAPSDYVDGHMLARMVAEATGLEWQ